MDSARVLVRQKDEDDMFARMQSDGVPKTLLKVIKEVKAAKDKLLGKLAVKAMETEGGVGMERQNGPCFSPSLGVRVYFCANNPRTKRLGSSFLHLREYFQGSVPEMRHARLLGPDLHAALRDQLPHDRKDGGRP